MRAHLVGLAGQQGVQALQRARRVPSPEVGLGASAAPAYSNGLTGSISSAFAKVVAATSGRPMASSAWERANSMVLRPTPPLNRMSASSRYVNVSSACPASISNAHTAAVASRSPAVSASRPSARQSLSASGLPAWNASYTSRTRPASGDTSPAGTSITASAAASVAARVVSGSMVTRGAVGSGGCPLHPHAPTSATNNRMDGNRNVRPGTRPAS